MIKTIVVFTRWLTSRLNSLLSWLEDVDRSTSARPKFVDLAPTDKADKAGVYTEALLFATSNTNVYNIALTGPYGSGKSSIVQSFLKKYKRPALHISLAAFVPETNSDGEKVSRQEIERSILQQMLYGADANKLPLSRFKRIQSPSVWSIFKSFYITLGVFALWYTFSQRKDILSGTFFIPFDIDNGFKLAIFLFAAIFLWMTLHHLYIASFGFSLKSISLKDVEIKPAHDDQTSILNRHLDEILYFFQSTGYDLVIIEDLDRFNDAEIFVTLREINSLVNDNAGVKGQIRFLYALRDDMFANTDRTKFFEFIVPVIPIINTSNSIDMVLLQGERLEIDQRLDRQFLRDVSRYLNDLRLIQNIFNEYAIYVENLETDGESLLDANKLLAIMIYKNVYPRDFEQLHRGAGILSDVLKNKDQLIRHGEANYRAQIRVLEAQLEIAERQTPSDLAELRRIYAMALIEKVPVGVIKISLEPREWIMLSQLLSHDSFESLIKAPRILCQYPSGNTEWVDISNFQAEVNAQRSYVERKKEIEIKGAGNKSRVLSQISELRIMIPTLRVTKFSELLRLNADQTEALFKGFEEDGELARFLILEGHLDDTYYQYISLFHSGRLSPNDNRFLIQIRAFVTPEPNFPIDNPREVIAAMRGEDFRQSYALNIKIVDILLNDQNDYPDQTQKFFGFLASEFESNEGFLSAYYTSGLNVSELLVGLLKSWENFLPTVIASRGNILHVAQLIAKLPLVSLNMIAKEFYSVSEFVAANLPEILACFPELAPERLEFLHFEVKDLSAIREYPEIVRFIFDKGRYELTINNLEYVYQEILGYDDLNSMRVRNFTSIRLTNNSVLINKVESEFNLYLKEILLGLQENSKEDASSILAILSKTTSSQDDLRKFLEMQTARLPDLEGVPVELHATLFQKNLIEATWINCLAFIENGGFDENSLTGYLDMDTVRATIMQHPMPNDSESLKLRQFLINAGSLSDAAYNDYVHSLPKSSQNISEGLESIKLRMLISEEKITFTKENFDALAVNKDLQILFFVMNIDAYLANHQSFLVDDEFLEYILRCDIDRVAKVGLIELMDLEQLVDLSERAEVIGKIIVELDVNISKISSAAAQSVVINSRPIATQITLFNKYNSLMSVEEVRHVLINLPHPFSDIKMGYAAPRLKNSPGNLELVKWLDSRNIISSWSQDSLLTEDIKVNLYRPRLRPVPGL